jgi:hypothetical protein
MGQTQENWRKMTKREKALEKPLFRQAVAA